MMSLQTAYAADDDAPRFKELPVSTFLNWRKLDTAAVIDAYQIEPLFHVSSQDGHDNGKISQGELDQIIQVMIPNKSTKVILYCRETFAPTRTFPATATVGAALRHMGYNNIYTLEKVYEIKDLGVNGHDLTPDAFRLTQVEPYKVSVPQLGLNYLNKLNSAPCVDTPAAPVDAANTDNSAKGTQ